MFHVKRSNINGFRHLGHQTPTLKAVGSNPAGRTNENPEISTVSGFCLWRVKVEYGVLLNL